MAGLCHHPRGDGCPTQPSAGTNFQVSRNNQLALDFRDGMQLGTASTSPEDGASAAMRNNQVILSAIQAAVPRPRQVRVSDTVNPNNFARRTVMEV